MSDQYDMTSEEIEAQLAARKLDCRYDVELALEPLLYRYGPVVLREQVGRWLERAPRNGAELMDKR